ncbi:MULTISPECIES: DUF4381 domain-containing protein [unclassified Arsukibacterium]|uniref:DUF4381 domain-containing protein n=1 Tax=unclassified Arsukibacterium TaxID=2635278 RepID=UPI000C93BB23|nr:MULTISPECIES: DUF4381 domain-containing protein [unclassified Arsukibacterium]MAA96485.1 hypothetical protein [Rheinheimera sp.]HAW94186.1 DUF4381 domain-containing protein [Candidatus Azambacteria bacterium]|tara:strand:- start:15975 stop:16466 length:492 start_codon:yes stop_codon:yes gene_type:complete
MAAKQLRGQLVDIAEPSYQLSWQIPLGIYILLTLIVGMLAYGSWQVYKRWRFLGAKRQAIILLNQLEPAATNQINQLLKRVVKHYAPAHPVLTASTLQWQGFLQQQLPATPLPALSILLYQGDADPEHSQQFYQFAKCWLSNLHPTSLVNRQQPLSSEEQADV